MKMLLLFLTVLLPVLTYGQKVAATFKNANEMGISIEKLDETYKSALHADSTKAAFHRREKEFYAGYVSMLKELNNFLHENNFSWGKATRCFNRIYLNKDGGIDYFLFNFSQGEIESAREKEFGLLLEKFIQTYQFPLKNDVSFAQCSPVKYSDN